MLKPIFINFMIQIGQVILKENLQLMYGNRKYRSWLYLFVDICSFHLKWKSLFVTGFTHCLKVAGLLLMLPLFSVSFVAGQTFVIDKKKFFTNEQIIEMEVVTDMKKLVTNKLEKDYATNYQPGTITFILPDSSRISDEIDIRPRGNFRREECYIPSVMIDFKTPRSVVLKKLGRLKFVWPCSNSGFDEQLVLKEYLVYKLYNLLTEKSFRVRLVKLVFFDISEKVKPRKLFGFFIEDVDDMARRNGCEEVEPYRPHTESTERKQTTLVSLFQYMIGNTDWAVPVYQNIKLIRSREDTLSKPFVVPYDFDYSGMVNANYAIPDPELGTASVRERVYRGFPRTMEELKEVIQIFARQKAAMDSLIKNFKELEPGHKKEMSKYLDDFFKIIADEKDIRYIFINNARRE
jgi:hypothetical protein